jgi:hypothetical protein
MVRGDCKAGAATRLLFCTYGVLLRRLQQDQTLLGVDYVGECECGCGCGSVGVGVDVSGCEWGCGVGVCGSVGV